MKKVIIDHIFKYKHHNDDFVGWRWTEFHYNGKQLCNMERQDFENLSDAELLYLLERIIIRNIL